MLTIRRPEVMVRRDFALPAAARALRHPLAAARSMHRRTPCKLKDAYWRVFRVGMMHSPHFVKVRYRRMSDYEYSRIAHRNKVSS